MAAESVHSVPCLLFALRRESMYFRRANPVWRQFSGAPCCAQFRGPGGKDSYRSDATVLMLETGIGSAAMETALSWCLSGPPFAGMPYRPPFVVSVGFSGSLQPEQRVGDLVMATEVVDQYGECWPAILPDAWANCFIAAGRLLTVPDLVSDPEEKQRLGRQYKALAVDMESAVAARLCHQHEIPFACLRVISDDCETALSPHLVELLQQGRVSLPRLAWKVLRHPHLIGELGRLARQTRQASRNLLIPLSALTSAGQRSGKER